MKIIEKIDYFIPAEIQGDFLKLSKARITVASALKLFALMAILIIPIAVALFSLVTAFSYPLALGIMKRVGSIQISGLILMISGFAFITNIVVHKGGLHSPTAYSFCIIILFGFLLTGFRAGLVWFGITLVAIFSRCPSTVIVSRPICAAISSGEQSFFSVNKSISQLKY